MATELHGRPLVRVRRARRLRALRPRASGGQAPRPRIPSPSLNSSEPRQRTSGETTTWTYDTLSRVDTQTFASGFKDTYHYNARGFVDEIDHKNSSNSLIASENYTHDDGGNLTYKTFGPTLSRKLYAYDAINQLTQEKHQDKVGASWVTDNGISFDYNYDNNGNRLTKKAFSASVPDYYNVDNGDKLTSVTAGYGGSTIKSFTYDSAGNTKTVVTSAGTRSLDYDFEGRVTKITYPGGTNHDDYAYNGLDARITTSHNGSSTGTYRRDGVDPTSPVMTHGSATFSYGLSENRSGTSKFYSADRMGTVTHETNGSQTTTSTKQYDAFGLLLSSTGSSASQFGYAGGWGYQEDASGLKLLGHRYYDPSEGRFISRDPAKDGVNWYSYANNNPVRYCDPAGLSAGEIFEFIIGLGGGRSVIYHVVDDTEEVAINYAQTLREGGEVVEHGPHSGGPRHWHNVEKTPEGVRYPRDDTSAIHVTTSGEANKAGGSEWGNWRKSAKPLSFLGITLDGLIFIFDPDPVSKGISAGNLLSDIVDGPVRDCHNGYEDWSYGGRAGINPRSLWADIYD